MGAPKKKATAKAVSKRGSHFKRGMGCNFHDQVPLDTLGPGAVNLASALDGSGSGVVGAGAGEPSVDVTADALPEPVVSPAPASSSTRLDASSADLLLDGAVRSPTTHDLHAVDSSAPVSYTHLTLPTKRIV